MAWETWVQSLVEWYQRLKKWDLMPSCLTLSTTRCGSRVEWSNPGKGVAPSTTSWCSSYQKGRLQVTLDKGRQQLFSRSRWFIKLYMLMLFFIKFNWTTQKNHAISTSWWYIYIYIYIYYVIGYHLHSKQVAIPLLHVSYCDSRLLFT